MKLFVWVDPCNVDCGPSLLFAIAEDVETAKAVAAKGPAYSHGQYQQTTPTIKLGDPQRIVGLPCAEWHRWSE